MISLSCTLDLYYIHENSSGNFSEKQKHMLEGTMTVTPSPEVNTKLKWKINLNEKGSSPDFSFGLNFYWKPVPFFQYSMKIGNSLFSNSKINTFLDISVLLKPHTLTRIICSITAFYCEETSVAQYSYEYSLSRKHESTSPVFGSGYRFLLIIEEQITSYLQTGIKLKFLKKTDNKAEGDHFLPNDTNQIYLSVFIRMNL